MKITANQPYRCISSVFILSLLTSIIISCASVDKIERGEEPPESTASVETNDSRSTESASTVEEDDSADTASADALMATLAAPIEEPVSIAQEKKVKSVKKAIASAQAEAIVVEKVKVVEPAKQVVAAKAASKPKPVKKARKSGVAKPLKVGMKDLPVTYDIWILKNGDTPLTQGLVISTPTWEMGKEGYMSQIWLTLMEDKLLVNSSSDIATRSGNLGVKIDGGDLTPFSRIAENNIGIVDGKWLDKLAAASSIEIHLGFFPGKKPLSKVFTSKTSLENLDRVVLTQRKLSK